MKKPLTAAQITFIVNLYKKGKGRITITKEFNRKYQADLTQYSMRRIIEKHTQHVEKDIPKVLFLDIETAPILAWVWNTRNVFVQNNMIVRDWYILSWSAKWAGDPENKVMYQDLRGKNGINKCDDKKIMKSLRDLMDEADIIIYQNGDKFDLPRINTRLLEHGIEEPSEFLTIDTLKIAQKHYGFTSNKLEYLTKKLCKKYKKLNHSDFAGVELWLECMKDNKKAWDSMEKYNKYDVLSLEELFLILSRFVKNEKVTRALRALKK